MDSITQEEYDKACKIWPYYEGRWPYYKACLNMIAEEDFSNVLELGPYKLPLIHGSDTMDIKRLESITYNHDAMVTPWPIKDKHYDLFIALQVWEHLEDKQIEAFKEVIRISKMAILSFPYNLNIPDDPVHHGIDDEKILSWTCNMRPEKSELISIRKVYLFKF